MTNPSFDPTFLNLPIRALNINNVIYPIVTREATIHRGVNRHDSISLSALLSGNVTYDGKVEVPLDAALPASGTRAVAVQSLVGQPVTFVYGVSPQTEQFFGFITAIEATQKFKEGLNLTITMTGCSMQMQYVIRRFDTNKTMYRAIADRVQEAGLGLFGEATTYVWPSRAQTSQTDWQTAAEIAAAENNVLFTWGAVVRVHDPLSLFRQHPMTTLVSSDDILETDRKLLDFKPVEQSAVTLDLQGLEVFYFDPAGKVQSLRTVPTNDHPVWSPYSSTPVQSQEQAQSMLHGTPISRWTQKTVARIKGDASIYPGVIVSVRSGQDTFNFNGRWLVLKVLHSMDRKAFQTELHMARPALIPVTQEATFSHFWSKTSKPTAFMRNQQWYSSVVGAA